MSDSKKKTETRTTTVQETYQPEPTEGRGYTPFTRRPAGKAPRFSPPPGSGAPSSGGESQSESSDSDDSSSGDEKK